MATPRRQSSKDRVPVGKRSSAPRAPRRRKRVKSLERAASALLAEVLAESGLPVPVPGASPDSQGASGQRALVETPAPIGFGADITDELDQGAQAFGDVLMSIGNAVALSQAALDEAAIETAKQLSQTKIEVAVAVRQGLNDSGDLDGLPPVVETRTLSLSNYILPTLHQWQHVALSMDLTVSELDATTGVKVRSGGASASVSAGGGSFSAAGEFNYSSLNAESRLRSDFANGAVRLDALLGPRDEFRFPEVADFAIGPRLLVTQASTAGKEVAAAGMMARVAPHRTVKLTVRLERSDGTPLEGKSIDVRLSPELRRRLVNPVSGTVPVERVIEFILDERFVPEPAQTHRVSLKFGDLTKVVDVTL